MSLTPTPVLEERPAPPTEPSGYRWHQRLGLIGGVAAMVLLLLLPAPEGLTPGAWRAAAVAALMAIWWMTEALPIAATSLVPLVAFPVLGIAPIGDAAAPYANPLIFLFLGGFMLALAMERWGLHRRIALSLVRRIGVRPRPIIGGFMVTAALLSMWVSNTATAMMMLPIGLSLVQIAEDRGGGPDGTGGGAHHFTLGLMLAIAYGCSVGGLGTLVGTPTNAFLAGFLLEAYDYEIAFADWLLVGLPIVILGLPIIFVVLTRVVYPVRLRELPGGRAFIDAELAKLGTITRPERMVAAVVVTVALLWVGRQWLDNVVPGLSDAGIAMAGALLLFVLPVDLRRGVFLLDWESTQRLPWGVLVLFGGGLSLAAAIQQTGLAAWIGARLEFFASWPTLLLILATVLLVVFLTELTSNTATAAAFLPVLAALTVGIGESPLLLAVPATVAASCAFMLPVATPPNAIIYGSGYVRLPEMARAGLVLNAAFTLLVAALTYLLLPFVFDV